MSATITYQVNAAVEPEQAEAYERYMRERHIRDVLATGCFHDATLERAGPGRYRVRYRAPSQAALDEYLREHAARLRAEVADYIAGGVVTTRENWEELEHWEGERHV